MHAARYYQQTLIDDVMSFWAGGGQTALAVAPTGSGKTFIFARIASLVNVGVCAIAHRGELIAQISTALAREGVRHRVVGPTALARRCTLAHLEELGRDFVQPTSRIVVAGVDTLVKTDPSEPWLQQIGLWIQDECFPAGTLVDGRRIETFRVGDAISAFNESTGALEARAVTRLFKSAAPRQMARVSSGGRELVVTPGHPFWTKRGWVPAGELTRDDLLLHALQKPAVGNVRVPALPLPEDRQDLLPETMRVRRAADKTPRGAAERALLHVREPSGPVGAPLRPDEHDGPGVLLDGVPRSGVVKDDGRNEPAACLRADAGAQSDASAGDSGEDGGLPTRDRSPAFGTRGERATGARTGTGLDRAPAGVGVCPTTRGEDWDARGAGTSPGVQSRCWTPAGAHRRGSGWGEPFRETPSPGCETGRVLAWARVDDLAFLERGDPGYPLDGFVYNLEVAGLHTYLAEGVVVHNCHHVLKGNKWGKAAQLFPNARGLGVTATPVRADGKGLGLHADGLFEQMFVGPTMRALIDQDYLTDYKIYAPPSDLDLTGVAISAGGDFNPDQLATARKKSHITGDVVQHYLRLASGKRGVTFDTDVESATQTAAAYRAAGVPAEVVSGKTPDALRADTLRRFKRGEILQLVNVDLFGEGFDLPAIEVVSFARPTMSFALFAQQFGRSLRRLEGKQWAVIIDHVGNTLRHGLPDAAREWSLDRRERRGSNRPSDVVPTRVCVNPACNGVYERVYPSCPYCGHTPLPAGRSSPELVDGDLIELDADTLRRMRGEINRIDGAPQFPVNAGPEIRGAIAKNHFARQQAQAGLRRAIALWAGWQREQGREDSESYRRFYHRYGVDVASAQVLGASDAEALAGRVRAELERFNVKEKHELA